MKFKAGQYGSNDPKPMQERLRPDDKLDNAALTSDRASYSDYECVNIHQQPNNLILSCCIQVCCKWCRISQVTTGIL